MMRIVGIIGICLVSILPPILVHAQNQDAWPNEPAISVVGEAVVRATPDIARVHFSVVTLDPDPEEARRRNAEASREAMNVAREIVQDERDVRLENLRLQPQREYDPETRRTIDRGFEASRDVVVRVRDLDQLPTLVARIVQHGANRLNSVSYELEDPDSVRNEALRQAALKARQKATLLATELGARAGRILRIQERPMSPVYPMRDMQEAYMAARSGAEPEPEAYAAGEIEVRALLELVLALE